ncbi:MAG: [acyl-carrier-protein] S-malonyltransferase [Pelagibacterales bacterium]|nr:[acyl-carrier-protein] S-malonyltransferase [Pelagibacterales bacterium]
MQAILFPGQGSQYVGMGSDFYNKFEIVKKIFKSVDETLGYSLSDIILNGPESELKLTKNTQPAIMALGVSIFNVLKNFSNLNLKNANFFAGHSLGEYTALVCSGSLTLENAAYLLHERGKAMQQAVPEGHGAMTAVLGMTIEEVENEIRILNTKEVCEVANDNCNGQVVVSGTKKIIATLNENLKKINKRGIVLPVSAPFHCSLMKDASVKMEEKILKTDFAKPMPAIISNVTAKEENNVDTIKSLLIKQIVSRVRWRESVHYMIKMGVTDFIEVGPGKVLSGLIKKIDKTVKVRNINSIEVINN